MRLSVSSQKRDQCDKGNLSPFLFHCRAESGCLCSLAVHGRSWFSSLGLGYSALPASSSRVLNSKRQNQVFTHVAAERRGVSRHCPGCGLCSQSGWGLKALPRPSLCSFLCSSAFTLRRATPPPDPTSGLTSYLRKGGCTLEAGKASRGGWGAGRESASAGNIFTAHQAHQNRVPVNQAYLNPGSRY